MVIEIVSFSIQNGDFPYLYMLNYQRVIVQTYLKKNKYILTTNNSIYYIYY